MLRVKARKDGMPTLLRQDLFVLKGKQTLESKGNKWIRLIVSKHTIWSWKINNCSGISNSTMLWIILKFIWPRLYFYFIRKKTSRGNLMKYSRAGPKDVPDLDKQKLLKHLSTKCDIMVAKYYISGWLSIVLRNESISNPDRQFISSFGNQSKLCFLFCQFSIVMRNLITLRRQGSKNWGSYVTK